MTELAEFFNATNGPVDPLREDLYAMIVQRYTNTPRNLQRELGPSEVGHPCMRKLAYGLMQVERQNPEYNPMPSIVGTSVHIWLQIAALHANAQLGRERWLTETKVHVTPGLSGSSDLYDCDTATVIDWKVPDASRFTMYKENPGPTYIGQVNLYGLGYENAGYLVKRVAIALVPRDGQLRRMHVWSDDYRRDVAERILATRDRVIALCDDLEVEKYPERYEWIPTVEHDCLWCPWWRPEPRNPYQCKGDA